MDKKLVFGLGFVLLFPIILLALSGNFLWPEGWIFSAWFIALCYTTIIYLYRKDPALLAERYQKPGAGNQEGWDLYVVIGLAVSFVAWVVLIPLDAERFRWSPAFPLWIQAIGLACLAASFFLFFRSYKDNPYLSPLVRYQEEREQKVVSTGVYGFVRHPMYLGAVLMFIGAPLLMGSILGAGIGVLVTVLLMARIKGEEAMLARELEGYGEYRKKVRYRLFPFIW